MDQVLEQISEQILQQISTQFIDPAQVLNVRDISEVLSELEEQDEPKEGSNDNSSDSPNDLSAQLQRLTQANLDPRGELELFDTIRNLI